MLITRLQNHKFYRSLMKCVKRHIQVHQAQFGTCKIQIRTPQFQSKREIKHLLIDLY